MTRWRLVYTGSAFFPVALVDDALYTFRMPHPILTYTVDEEVARSAEQLHTLPTAGMPARILVP